MIIERSHQPDVTTGTGQRRQFSLQQQVGTPPGSVNSRPKPEAVRQEPTERVRCANEKQVFLFYREKSEHNSKWLPGAIVKYVTANGPDRRHAESNEAVTNEK